MSLQDHVPELSLCQEWKKVGGMQDTLFEWVEYGRVSGKKTWVVQLSIECEHGETCIAAPLASELMEWMKKHTPQCHWNPYTKCYHTSHTGYGTIATNQSLPNALIQMAIVLKKEEK